MKTLKQIVEDAGMRPVDLASKARLSIDTVSRAIKGHPPNPVGIWAMSVALGVDESDIRSAITASQPRTDKEAQDGI